MRNNPKPVRLSAGVRTLVAELPTSTDRNTSVTVITDTSALSGFEVWGRGDENSAPVLLASTSADFINTPFLDRCLRGDALPTDLTTLPAGVSGMVGIETSYFAIIQIYAKAVSNCTITVSSGGK